MRETAPPNGAGDFLARWAARRAAAQVDAAAPAMVVGPWGHARIRGIAMHPTALATSLPGHHRSILLRVRGLALGEPAVLPVWALAQLAGRTEAAVLCDAKTLRGRRLVYVRRGADPAVGLTAQGRAVAALLHHWRTV